MDEVAVHPSHRRKGLGEVLTLWAIQNLGDRTITLVVMDENPARNLYEKLGFVVWEERLDLMLPGR
ncbi:MAG: GNAT family N-acetyltransferase [Gammaproteobacteria bacterium]|nr:GNAT family N-acetyltransferase [Gammaproteobacteria bacterium]